AVVMYNSATESRRITDATQDLGSLVGGIRNLFGAQGDYAGLSKQVVIKAGFIPNEMHNGDDQIHHEWADNAVDVAAAGATNREFTVEFSAVPEKACISLAGSTIGNVVRMTI